MFTLPVVLYFKNKKNIPANNLLAFRFWDFAKGQTNKATGSPKSTVEKLEKNMESRI